MDLLRFDTIAVGIHNTCDINNVSAGRKNMFMLCDDEWITPIKYEIIQQRRL